MFCLWLDLDEQVEKIANGDQIQSVIKTGKSRGLPELEKLSVISVSMTDDIPFDQLDDIVFVFFHSSSKKIFFKPIEVQEKDVNQSAELWARTLLDVWANSSRCKIPKSPFLIERFHSVSESMIVFSAAQSLLASREVRCPDCNEVFSLTTAKEREAFQDHTRNHQVEKFKCECDVVLTSNVDKIKHIQLAHSNGKFVKCEDCEFIGIEAEVTEHRTKQHQTFICDVCATVSKNLAKHKNHVKKHVPIKCKDCPEEFIGKANLLEHRTKVHGDRFPCKWCGKVFSATWKLKTHITGAHATPRFMCDLCGQEFRLKTTMYRHKISVHIKNRPFVCRYGCGADYNDECNLRTHEKKTHGGAFQGSSFNHIYKNLWSSLEIDIYLYFTVVMRVSVTATWWEMWRDIEDRRCFDIGPETLGTKTRRWLGSGLSSEFRWALPTIVGNLAWNCAMIGGSRNKGENRLHRTHLLPSKSVPEDWLSQIGVWSEDWTDPPQLLLISIAYH